MKVVNNGLTIEIGGAFGHFPKEFVVSALEKQIAKKPTVHKVEGNEIKIGNGWWCNGTTVYKCPCCNSWITQTYKYCIDCGQALDWGDCE